MLQQIGINYYNNIVSYLTESGTIYFDKKQLFIDKH